MAAAHPGEALAAPLGMGSPYLTTTTYAGYQGRPLRGRCKLATMGKRETLRDGFLALNSFTTFAPS